MKVVSDLKRNNTQKVHSPIVVSFSLQFAFVLLHHEPSAINHQIIISGFVVLSCGFSCIRIESGCEYTSMTSILCNQFVKWICGSCLLTHWDSSWELNQIDNIRHIFCRFLSIKVSFLLNRSFKFFLFEWILLVFLFLHQMVHWHELNKKTTTTHKKNTLQIAIHFFILTFE